LSSSSGVRQGVYRNNWVRKLARVLDAMPHPLVACEIAPTHVAAARWKRGTYNLDKYAVEPFVPEALRPSAVETNLVDGAAVRSAVEAAMSRIGARNEQVALFLPDSVIRVFVLHFDVFPRSASEAIPMLRWRLKKSVPFEAEETLISYMRQAPRDEGVDIVTGLARLRIVREYESLLEPLGLQPGVVMSTTLATLPLLDDRGPTMLARLSGAMLTTAIAREGILCGYRCTDLPSSLDSLEPRALLEEIFPVAAYYQDAWSEGLQGVQLAGFGERINEFQEAIHSELQCPVASLLRTAEANGRIGGDARPLAQQELDSLLGWSMNRGA
jgi:type IV pilus assembly protein PilM